MYVYNNMRAYRRSVSVEGDMCLVSSLVIRQGLHAISSIFLKLEGSQVISMTVTHTALCNQGIRYACKSVPAFSSIIYYPRFPTVQSGQSSTQSETMLFLQEIVSLLSLSHVFKGLEREQHSLSVPANMEPFVCLHCRLLTIVFMFCNAQQASSYLDDLILYKRRAADEQSNLKFTFYAAQLN